MKRIIVPKGKILQMKGDKHTKVYNVVKGLLRSYSIDEKGKEHIFLFASEGWFMGDSVAPDESADLFIDAIEDSEVLVFAKEDEVPGHHIPKLMRRMAVLQKRVIMLMSASAIKRYEHFIDTYPDITQRVPQRMIASYLGITPEALSSVKRARLQK